MSGVTNTRRYWQELALNIRQTFLAVNKSTEVTQSNRNQMTELYASSVNTTSKWRLHIAVNAIKSPPVWHGFLVHNRFSKYLFTSKHYNRATLMTKTYFTINVRKIISTLLEWASHMAVRFGQKASFEHLLVALIYRDIHVQSTNWGDRCVRRGCGL